MVKTTRRFKNFPLIYIDTKRAWGNPTLGPTRMPIFKIWEMVTAKCMDDLIEDEPTLTLGEINSVMEFVEWCMELGLMEVTEAGRLRYDKDALYRASALDLPPKGFLCLYCHGFLPHSSPASTHVRDRLKGSEDVREGVAHSACVQAAVLGEPAPRANVLT